jgi:NAD(P)-dependent dehydrogenase (short-subunit alcohol dehydrogenase family)
MNHSQTFRLDNKNAVVTGGASGIGLAIAQTFASQGATVRIIDVNGERAAEAAAKIAASGGQASAHPCDLTDEAAVERVFNEIAAGGHLDILVNNVGMANIGTVETTSSADFDRVMQVNVKTYFLATRAAVPPMKANGGGVILNMASIAGSSGLLDRFAYSTSKGAVIAMTFSMARDLLKHKIRCNCISPARVHTPFVDGYLRNTYPGREEEMYKVLSAAQPIGRMGKPEEVALLALYLCSDAASFITGCDYPLDGGFFKLHG